nr:reverse transcriptase domain-containing protein [Tanacetum cinerariifolium]
MPNNVKTYDGTGDPEDHVKDFQASAQVERWAMPTLCHMFNSTLIGAARVWFDELPPESIDGYKDLRAAFLTYFMQQKKYVKDPVEIHNIKQRDGETIEDFMKRFKIKTRRMKGAPECMRISGFMHGVNNPYNKFCDFHNDKGHSTDECMQLKKQIEELVQAGKLSHLIKEIKQGQDQSKAGKKETAVKDKPTEIYIVQSWQRTVKQKVTQSFEWVGEIAFPKLAASNETEGPLVIEAEMGGHIIHRIYIDGGSSMEILYEHCFKRLRPEIKSQMVPATTSPTSFSGETIWPLGQLRLLVTIGDATHFTRAWMNFMVVKSMSPYNGIIGRSGLKAIQAVPSTVHGMLKFPVEGGIATIRNTILIPAECTSVTTSPIIPREEKSRPANFTVALHPDFPDQEPSDMTGVSRSVAEHRLNIREGYSPVRQKKRGQAPERAKAIQAEVQKLVDAGIMREVYYHDWLSNPIMTAEAEQAFKQLKQHLSELPLLVAPKPQEELIMYLSATYGAVSAVLMTERGTTQTPIYFISRALQGRELNYSLMEKLVMTRLDVAGRLQKRSIMLGEHNITYRPRTSVKGQILAYFLVEMPGDVSQAASAAVTQEEPWTLFTNGSSCVDGSGAGLILTNPEGVNFTYALREGSGNGDRRRWSNLNDTVSGVLKRRCSHRRQEGGKKAPPQSPSIRANGGSKCNDCQIHRPVTRHPQQSLTPITAPWPFYKWGIDIAGPFLEGPGKVKFLIVAMDYFTKWIEAKAVATITGGQVKKFVWENIVCRFGISSEIISDNGKQFADNPFKDCLGEGIKARLGEGNKNWVEELPHVLWAHRTMIKSSHGDTPFSLTYGTKAVIPAEIEMPTYHTAVVDVVNNDEELRLNLDLLEERRERVAVCKARAKSKMMKYYNARVRGVALKPKDFVYRSNDASHAIAGGKLGPK